MRSPLHPLLVFVYVSVVCEGWTSRLDAQSSPVIDMHLHAPSRAGELPLRAMLDSMNVRFATWMGGAHQLEETSDTSRFLPGLMFPCESGLAPNAGFPCLPQGEVWPDTAWLRREIKVGRVKMLGELTGQYFGVSPDDPRLEPYYALAEELDIPVGIHLGIGPPGVAYPGDRFPTRKSPNYRGLSGDPMALEQVLVRHPRLRLYVMHAAWPFLEEITYLLYMHPQVYADISVLQYAIPRPAYYDYLHHLMDAGFGKRLMFGSDGGAAALKSGVEAIRAAEFLSEEQKADLLYHNAARFLRIGGTGNGSSR